MGVRRAGRGKYSSVTSGNVFPVLEIHITAQFSMSALSAPGEGLETEALPEATMRVLSLNSGLLPQSAGCGSTPATSNCCRLKWLMLLSSRQRKATASAVASICTST